MFNLAVFSTSCFFLTLPLLFLISINDLPKSSLHGCLYMFADDAALFYESSDLPANVDWANDDLVVVENHLNDIGLTLNQSKTKCMQLHNSCRKIPSKPSIVMDDQLVDEVNSVKYLGLVLDSHLSWNKHIDLIASKIRSVVGVFYKLRSSLSCQLTWRKLSIYVSMIQSNLSFMNEV